MTLIKVIRSNASKDSTVMIDKRILQDPNLSLEAKGVMAFIMTLPVDADIRAEELQSHSNDSLETIQSALKELIDSGHIVEESN